MSTVKQDKKSKSDLNLSFGFFLNLVNSQDSEITHTYARMLTHTHTHTFRRTSQYKDIKMSF